jgi:hypothetical protein
MELSRKEEIKRELINILKENIKAYWYGNDVEEFEGFEISADKIIEKFFNGESIYDNPHSYKPNLHKNN